MLPETIWMILVRRIHDSHNVTPFLGAGAAMPALPSGAQLAQRMAEAYDYPFEDKDNLMRVAEYVAVNLDTNEPKDWVLKHLSQLSPPEFVEDEPHHVLANLPLPIYMTTNYDDFMVQALKKVKPVPRLPRREFCHWHEGLNGTPTVFDGMYQPTPASPLVYHLHGHTEAESLVLTEDDYIQFLARLSNIQATLPDPVRQALSHNTFLFLGYRLSDWNFRILFNALRPLAPMLSIAVLKPLDDPEMAEKQKRYMEKLYGRMNLIVCWATAREFCAELKRRCDSANGN